MTAFRPSLPPLSWSTTRLRGPVGTEAGWAGGLAISVGIATGAGVGWSAAVVGASVAIGVDGEGAALVHATANPAAALSAPVLKKPRRVLELIWRSTSLSADLVVGAGQRQQHQSAQARVGSCLLLLRIRLPRESGRIIKRLFHVVDQRLVRI